MKGGKRFSHGGRCDQGIFRHQLLGNLPRKVLIDTTLDVDFSKLIKLKLSILTQLLAFPPEIRLFGVGLRADGHILASGHRHGASHKSRDTRDQDIVLRRSRRGNADDQACGRDDTIGGPEHRGSQPPDAVAGFPPVRSDPPEQNKNDNDDQDGAEDTDATVTEAITVAAESATEATEQENDEDDNEDGSERHDSCPFAGPN